MDITVEVYKKDGRLKTGERLVKKVDHVVSERSMLEHTYKTTYLTRDGYRLEFHETWVTRTNMMGGKEYQERYDTPRYCSPSSEAYWSM
jgi:hypothetical protein